MPSAKHEPNPRTRATVRGLAAYGIEQNDIARMVGVSDRTLRKYYREELDLGLVQANAKVAEGLYAATRLILRPMHDANGQPVVDAKGEPVMAIDKNGLVATMFWLKTRAKWHETHKHIGGDKDEPPMRHQVEQKIDVSDLTEEQLAAVVAASDALNVKG